MSQYQAGILSDETPLARYLTFLLKPGAAPGVVLQRLGEHIDGSAEVPPGLANLSSVVNTGDMSALRASIWH